MTYLTPTAIVSIRWGNPYTEPPVGQPRMLWQATVLEGGNADAIRAQHGPDTVPGDGWGYCWSPVFKPIKRWSPERKARTRRARLRARLDKKVPLLADQLFVQEVARRPGYFDPVAIEAADAARDDWADDS